MVKDIGGSLKQKTQHLSGLKQQRLFLVYISGSQHRAILPPPQRHSAVSGNIFGCHPGERLLLAGSGRWVAAKHVQENSPQQGVVQPKMARVSRLGTSYFMCSLWVILGFAQCQSHSRARTCGTSTVRNITSTPSQRKEKMVSYAPVPKDFCLEMSHII